MHPPLSQMRPRCGSHAATAVAVAEAAELSRADAEIVTLAVAGTARQRGFPPPHTALATTSNDCFRSNSSSSSSNFSSDRDGSIVPNSTTSDDQCFRVTGDNHQQATAHNTQPTPAVNENLKKRSYSASGQRQASRHLLVATRTSSTPRLQLFLTWLAVQLVPGASREPRAPLTAGGRSPRHLHRRGVKRRARSPISMSWRLDACCRPQLALYLRSALCLLALLGAVATPHAALQPDGGFAYASRALRSPHDYETAAAVLPIVSGVIADDAGEDDVDARVVNELPARFRVGLSFVREEPQQNDSHTAYTSASAFGNLAADGQTRIDSSSSGSGNDDDEGYGGTDSRVFPLRSSHITLPTAAAEFLSSGSATEPDDGAASRADADSPSLNDTDDTDATDDHSSAANDSENTVAADPEFEAVRVQLYHWLMIISSLAMLISVFINLLVLCAARYIRKITPTVFFSLSLVAANAYAVVTYTGSMAVNSYLPIAYGWSPNVCWALLLEVFRMTGLTSSALHLLALAINHYVGILRPLHYASTVTRRRLTLVIVAIWLVPFATYAFIILYHPDNDFRRARCHFAFMTNLPYRVTVSSLFFAPLVIMTVIYIHIFITVKQNQRGFNRLGQKNRSAAASASGRTTSASQPTAGGDTVVGSRRQRSGGDATAPSAGGAAAHHLTVGSERGGSSRAGSGRQKQQLHMKRNVKAIITTLLILGTYLIGYLPAIVFYALTCEECPCPLGSMTARTRVAFGISTNSLIFVKCLCDPIIYTIRMPEVRNGLRRLWLARCCCCCSRYLPAATTTVTGGGGGGNSFAVPATCPARTSDRRRQDRPRHSPYQHQQHQPPPQLAPGSSKPRSGRHQQRDLGGPSFEAERIPLSRRRRQIGASVRSSGDDDDHKQALAASLCRRTSSSEESGSSLRSAGQLPTTSRAVQLTVELAQTSPPTLLAVTTARGSHHSASSPVSSDASTASSLSARSDAWLAPSPDSSAGSVGATNADQATKSAGVANGDDGNDLHQHQQQQNGAQPEIQTSLPAETGSPA